MTRLDCVKEVIEILKVKGSIMKLELYIHLNFMGVSLIDFNDTIQKMSENDVIQETMIGEIKKSNMFQSALSLIDGKAFL